MPNSAVQLPPWNPWPGYSIDWFRFVTISGDPVHHPSRLHSDHRERQRLWIDSKPGDPVHWVWLVS